MTYRPTSAELAAIDSAWLHDGIRKGFTMELDDPFRLRDGDALFVIDRDRADRVAGFVHLTVCRPSRSLPLSSMPRRADTPNGFSAWLVINATAWAREAGFARISLNFSPFAGPLVTRARPQGWAAQRGPVFTGDEHGPFPCSLPPNPAGTF